mmetsp:Transcript_59904/g.118948  ORF Transcript_59904/g.118948 Transcript_59904/m.118948 type:complete len:239 (+) Transcript_59904:219-935(+)
MWANHIRLSEDVAAAPHVPDDALFFAHLRRVATSDELLNLHNLYLKLVPRKVLYNAELTPFRVDCHVVDRGHLVSAKHRRQVIATHHNHVLRCVFTRRLVPRLDTTPTRDATGSERHQLPSRRAHSAFVHNRIGPVAAQAPYLPQVSLKEYSTPAKLPLKEGRIGMIKAVARSKFNKEATAAPKQNVLQHVCVLTCLRKIDLRWHLAEMHARRGPRLLTRNGWVKIRAPVPHCEAFGV